MQTPQKGQDIRQRTFNFAVRVVKLAHSLPKQPYYEHGMVRQLVASGTSIGANVEEAQAGQSTPDFISKYNIALKEARETHYWLRLLRATSEKLPQDIPNLIQEADEITRVIAAIILSTKKGKK